MNMILLKQVCILSALCGAILGILSLIPYINFFTFTALLLCLSAVILVYMKKNNRIGILDLREGAIFGGVIGFVSFLAFSAVYIPLNTLIGLVFKSSNNFVKYFFENGFGGIIVLGMLIIFIAMLSALMNGFAGLSTAYVYEVLTGMKKESNESVNFEIK